MATDKFTISRPLAPDLVRYVLTSGGTLHRYPAFEQCNLDDARITERLGALPSNSAGVPVPPGRPCKHCKPLD